MFFPFFRKYIYIMSAHCFVSLGPEPTRAGGGLRVIIFVIVFWHYLSISFCLCYCYLQARLLAGCPSKFIVIFISIRNQSTPLLCLAWMFKVIYKDSVFAVIILVHVKQSNGQSDGCFLFCREPSKQQIGENILRLLSPRKKWGKSTYIPT